MNGASALAPISWLGSMLSAGDAPAAASLEAGTSASAAAPNFATQLAALRVSTPAPGAGLRFGGNAPTQSPTDPQNDVSELATMLIAVVPATPVAGSPLPSWLGAATQGIGLPSLGESTNTGPGTGVAVTANELAEGLAISSAPTLAAGSSLQAPFAPTGVREGSQKKFPAGPFSATGRLAGSPLQTLVTMGSAVSMPATGPSATSMSAMSAMSPMSSSSSVPAATSTASGASAVSADALATDASALAGEAAGEALAALTTTVATLVPPVAGSVKPATANVLIDEESAAALEVEAALEELEALAQLESMDAESSAPEAAIEATQTRPSLHDLAAVAQGVQIEVQRGRDAQTSENRAWKLTAGDVGRRAAAFTELPMRAATAANSPAGSQAATSDAAADASSHRAAPFTAFASAPLTSETEGARAANPATAIPSAGPAAHESARTPRTDGDEGDAPRAALAHSITSDTPSAALRGPGALDANNQLLDLGARLRLAVADVIVDAGRDRLLDSVRDSFQARVTVHPPNLGTVQVQVTRESASSGLNILLVAAHQDGARALESETDNLIDDLVRHRLEVHEVNVRRGEGSSTDQPRDGQQRSSAQDQNARERREQQQAQERADDRQPGHRRSPDARWDYANPFVFESVSQDVQGSDLR